MELDWKRIAISDLTVDQKQSMYDLMVTYYQNIECNQFVSDLEEKDLALVLFDGTGKLVGFSTQLLINIRVNGSDIGVLFSGDTIIAKEHWGSMTLSIAFGKLMLDLLKKNPGKTLYWMLISKGLRTYKYLPVFFIEYYPNWENPTPDEVKELMDKLGEGKFPGSYNHDTGIIQSNGQSQFLKEEFHPEPNPAKPHEKFFVEKNPGYVKGDELLCLARLDLDNIHPFMRKVLINLK